MVSRLYRASILSLTLFSLVNVQAAVNIVECEDEQGNRSFQKVCPPDSTMIGEKKIATGASSDKNNSNINIEVTLYMIPDCEACDEIREFLGTRKISITEKNVNDNIELQNELTELTGALKVPTTVIGDELITGYSRSKFLSVLEAAGYTDKDS
jgi:glutaredoxin